MSKKKHKFLFFFIFLFIFFIGSLVFCAIYTYNNTWTYDDYRVKALYDSENECLDNHSIDYCLDTNRVILRDNS